MALGSQNSGQQVLLFVFLLLTYFSRKDTLFDCGFLL